MPDLTNIYVALAQSAPELSRLRGELEAAVCAIGLPERQRAALLVAGSEAGRAVLMACGSVRMCVSVRGNPVDLAAVIVESGNLGPAPPEPLALSADLERALGLPDRAEVDAEGCLVRLECDVVDGTRSADEIQLSALDQPTEDPAAALRRQHQLSLQVIRELRARRLELKRSNEQLARALEVAKRETQLRERVLMVVSHDLRGPLTVIDMAAAMMARHPHTVDENVPRIRDAAKRMGALIQDLLDLAALESGGLSMDLRPHRVQQTYRSIVAEGESLAKACESVAFELDERVADDVSVQADAKRVLQVLSNLVGNAFKFTESGVVTLRVEPREGAVRYSVIDTGPGIAPEALEHLFELHWQGDSRDQRGVGLGLATARAIVRAHSADLSVESQLGVGTTFWFQLPTA